jgi:hypothetical protein
MPHNLPGGYMFAGFGGAIIIKNKDAAAQRIEVAEWQIERKLINGECTHSGCMGAITRRRTGLDWKAKLKIWFDGALQADYQLESSLSVEISLFIGTLAAWQAYGFTDQAYYWAPSGLVDTIRTIDSSEGRDVVRQEITLDGNSLMFLRPVDEVAAQAYIAASTAKGWTL